MICRVDECDGEVRCKSLCAKHYSNYLRHGKAVTPHGNRQHETCTLPECDESHQAKGLCSKHYTRYQRHGDPNYVKEEHNPKAPDYCELDGCEKEHAAKGFCRDHYAQHYRDKHKSYYRSLRRLRHSRRREAQPSWANAHRIESFYDKARWLTDVTGVQHHVDHIDPLTHDKVCGLHVSANLQVVEASYNHEKKNSFDLGDGNVPLREQVNA